VGDRKAAAAVYANQVQVQGLRNAELEADNPVAQLARLEAAVIRWLTAPDGSGGLPGPSTPELAEQFGNIYAERIRAGAPRLPAPAHAADRTRPCSRRPAQFSIPTSLACRPP
jgi:hypothetical protein